MTKKDTPEIHSASFWKDIFGGIEEKNKDHYEKEMICFARENYPQILGIIDLTSTKTGKMLSKVFDIIEENACDEEKAKKAILNFYQKEMENLLIKKKEGKEKK